MPNNPRIGLVGPLDNKSAEYFLARDVLQKAGCDVLIVDVCTQDIDTLENTSTDEQVILPMQLLSKYDDVRGTHTDRSTYNAMDRSTRNDVLRTGSLAILSEERKALRLHGLASFGGSQTTALAASIMRDAIFEIGFPKVAVTTMIAGDVSGYVGESDIVLWPSVVDISGRLNSISTSIITNAACALSAMAKSYLERSSAGGRQSSRPQVALSMFGLTTPCVNEASRLLTQKGFEPVVFHSSGTGGRSMERLIGEHQFDAVLDFTTTELADELLGGILSAGPERLEAAASTQVPQIISVGALDMANFGPKASVPSKFLEDKSRKIHVHNSSITLVRTNVEENRELGKLLGEKAMKSRSFKILFPEKGISGIDCSGGPFEDIAARMALLEGIKNVVDDTHIENIPCHINDPQFALKAVEDLLALYYNEKH